MLISKMVTFRDRKWAVAKVWLLTSLQALFVDEWNYRVSLSLEAPNYCLWKIML